MKCYSSRTDALLVLACATVLQFCSAAEPRGWILSGIEDPEQEWPRFKKTFHKHYHDDHEELQRFEIFKVSMDRAVQRNLMNIQGGGQPVFGVTKFSDFTQDEFDRRHKGRAGRGVGARRDIKVFAPELDKAFTPAEVDWVAAGATTPVKNQGQCGSCWAFSATEQIESQWILSGQAPWPLSVQQAVSCTEDMYGCGGGDTIAVFEQLLTGETKSSQPVPGLVSAAMVPYTQSMYEECLGRSCTLSCRTPAIGNLTNAETYEALTGYYVAISGYAYATAPCTGACTSQDLDTLNAYVAKYGPVSVCVNAQSWNDYVSGVITTAGCGGYSYYDLDHCVQLTGYNLSAPEPYFAVRNSWATDWGVDGYVYLSAQGNTCGVANEATYVNIVPPD